MLQGYSSRNAESTVSLALPARNLVVNLMVDAADRYRLNGRGSSENLTKDIQRKRKIMGAGGRDGGPETAYKQFTSQPLIG